MYSFYEIRIVFARCVSISEVIQASDAFDSIIEDNGFTPGQKNFAKQEAIVRLRQIKANQRKN